MFIESTQTHELNKKGHFSGKYWEKNQFFFWKFLQFFEEVPWVPLWNILINTKSAVYTDIHPNQLIRIVAIFVAHQFIGNTGLTMYKTLPYLSWWLRYSPLFVQKIQSFWALFHETIPSQDSKISSRRWFWVNLVVTFPINGDNHVWMVSKIFEKSE